MSSRSTSPNSSNFRSGPNQNNGLGGGGALSKDALYAPLSTYDPDRSPPSTRDAATAAPSPSEERMDGSSSRHSLSLRPAKSHSVPSLVSTLASVCQCLKTRHPRERELYLGAGGGSISRFGMGDDDRTAGEGSMRAVLEGKLSNRSLVLVGGGVHTARGGIGDHGEGTEASGGVASLGRVAAGGGRERKRATGNEVFGSISNKKRKRMRQIMEKKRKGNVVDSKLKTHDGDAVEDRDKNHDKKGKEKSSEKLSLAPINKRGNVRPALGDIIMTLHKMWTEYMPKLLFSMMESNAVRTTTTDSPPLSLDDRKQISTVLSISEHVGMPATIVECPSRRHLVPSRCIVLDETKETWKVAMATRNGEVNEKERKQPDTHGSETLAEQSHRWKIFVVPKRGTVLEVHVPWDEGSVSVDVKGNPASLCQQKKTRFITVMLET